MKVVYVAGPFSAPTAWGIAENVRAAERYGLAVARLGAMPLIPHANTAHFHGEGDDHVWIEGTLELLRRCDAAVFIPGWVTSRGSQSEWDVCRLRRVPKLDLNAHSLLWREQMQALGAFIRTLEASNVRM
jgi:hypothetical protein